MAKKEKGRLRVFFAEFEGDDETIQEGLRAIGSAVNKTFQPATKVVKVLTNTNGNAAGDIDLDDELLDVEPYDDDDVIDATPSKKSKSPRTRKPPVMSIVKDLDLKPEGNTAFREFIEEKQPKDQQAFIACAVYYLDNVLGTEGISPDHIFTCFKDAGRRTPADLPQAIRNIANRKGWVDSRKQNDITITNIGENFVEHDLPPSGAAEG
ncbi:hypothetical protein [Aeoliella mucimassa]|uniref:Uncharacterized protein n=1 Tax=Aeoliella mucimassa TaxID=2527972 RepID=A0A518AVT1_9BACT|nr:hypothetical protein [Aeoliella mucimassa]QDU58801.1 hypothetical protein Pan181_50410 [Aeoliella mucimassa]